nr:MAG TPA: hypothetical protein [Caudoviricetes sp.]
MYLGIFSRSFIIDSCNIPPTDKQQGVLKCVVH